MKVVQFVLAALAIPGLAACQAPIANVPTPVAVEPSPAVATHTPVSASSAPDPTALAAPSTPETPPAQVAPTSFPQTALPFRRALALAEPRLQGEDVRLVQQRLFDLGYVEVGVTDGIFGPATEGAVRAFQQQQGLEVDGIVGPQTWAGLFTPAGGLSAIHPIIIVAPNTILGANWLLGASSAAGWVAGPAAAGALAGGERYQLDGGAAATGATPEFIDDTVCPNTFGVELSPAPTAERAVAVAGNWALTPRQPVDEDPAAYTQAVAAVLQARGIAQPDVSITSVKRVDLDNDGSSEIIISASRDRDNLLTPGVDAGDYSLILVQRAQGERVDTIQVVGDYYPVAEEFRAPQEHQLLGLHDLNGDGTMELVVFSRYYEGASAAAYVLNGATAQEVLATGCGV